MQPQVQAHPLPSTYPAQVGPRATGVLGNISSLKKKERKEKKKDSVLPLKIQQSNAFAGCHPCDGVDFQPPSEDEWINIKVYNLLQNGLGRKHFLVRKLGNKKMAPACIYTTWNEMGGL